ncbi:hypothetical protein [Cellulosimicrobium cellulans]|uniref:hypothetical protein n=1 Tax=Cellulosimicrobium cellulans TaxID=1710 RepID=UPI0020CBD142|nr:hypothetical protein NMQ07_18135 [Cellulosimicrobium cellulans]
MFGEAPRLDLDIDHFRERAAQRRVPVDLIESFRPPNWELVLVEARQDTGWFLSTTWCRPLDAGCVLWIVVGYRNAVRTAYVASSAKRGDGREIVHCGPLRNLAADVNAALLNSI